MHSFAILYIDAVMQIKQFITYTVKLTLHCSNLLFTALTYSALLQPTLHCFNLLHTASTYSKLF